MKRLKKLLLGMVTTVLLLASALTVYADPSRTDGPYVSGEAAEKGWYVILPWEEAFKELQVNEPDLYAMIEKFNAGEIDKNTLLKNFPDILKALEGKEAITDIVDLVPVNGGNIVNGKHVVSTVTIPSLNTNMSDAVILHYSEVRKIWEIVTPTSVDYKTGVMSAIFEDVSPIVVFANVNTTSGSTGNTSTGSSQSSTGSSTNADSQAQGTSPKTESNNVWALWIGAAAILLVCGSTVVCKKRKN